MEKLVYLLWRPPGREPDDFCDALLGPAAEALLSTTTGRLSALLVDAAAEAVARARITHLAQPPSGAVTLWLDCVEERAPVEAALSSCCDRIAGYLVTESVPRPNTTHRAPVGQRTPGITMFSMIEKPDHIDTETWLSHWQEHHTPVANEVQCTYLYIRNAVARALSPDAPPWRGLVEEGFPADAVTNPMRWYRAEGDPAALRRNLERMLESVRGFLDIERVESHPMSEYVLRSG